MPALLAFLLPLLAFAAAPKIDPTFTPEERAVILHAVELLPACHRARVESLRFVRSGKLDGPADECTEGFYPGDGSIVLYPRCGFDVGTVVHEGFHHLGRFGALNETWRGRVLRRIPSCPVSEYAADGLGANNEDLAETGRLLLVPGTAGSAAPAACVAEKLRTLAALLAEGCR